MMKRGKGATLAEIMKATNWQPHVRSELANGLTGVAVFMDRLRPRSGCCQGYFGRAKGHVLGLGVTVSNVFAGLGGCSRPIETTDALHKRIEFQRVARNPLPNLWAIVASGAGYILSGSLRYQHDPRTKRTIVLRTGSD